MVKADELRVMDRYIPNGKYTTVFDVGAYIGKWTRWCHNLKPRVRIHAFEPIKTHYEEFKNVNIDILDKIIVSNTALCSECDLRQMNHYEPKSYNASFYEKKDGKIVGSEMVICETIDNYCFIYGIKHIDFLKIDCEGSDDEVIVGAQRMLLENKIKVIQIEYGGIYTDNPNSSNYNRLVELLPGFKFYGIGYETEVPIDGINWGDFGNFLAVKNVAEM